MLGRVAACGITAFLLASPALPIGETNFADRDASVASVVVAASRDQMPDQISDQIPAQTEDLVRDDAQIQAKVAVLEPAEPSIKSRGARPAIQSAALPEPFGLNTVRMASGEVLTKWRGVQTEIRTENDILSLCRANAELCPAAARTFLAIIAQGRAQTGRARIGMINRAINLAIRPVSDLAQWGVIDHWSAPLETFTIGRGDCEDYAIAKYVALIQAGVAAEDVRLIIVRDLDVGEDHAVVAAHLDGDWVILDNRRLMLVKDSEMRRVVPLFVLDEAGVTQFAPTTTPAARNTSAPYKSAASPDFANIAIAATAHGHDFTLPSSRAMNPISHRWT